MYNPNQSIVESASNFLTDMIDAGAIDTPFKPFDDDLFYVQYFDWFLETIAPQKRAWQNQDWFEVHSAAQSLRWQEHEFDAVTHPNNLTDYWAVELARFYVPNGHLGFVQFVEQVVNDVDGGYYPTNVTYWGSPRYMESDVNNLRFYLKLSEYDGTAPARYNVNSAAIIRPEALPGAPYPDLPIIRGLWYPAHLQRRMKLIVPEQSVLRFYMITPPTTTYVWEVSGKLSGNTQSTFSNCSVVNAREL